MRVLIISITAGYGHHATARAVSEGLRERNVEVANVDLLQYVSKPLFDAVDKGYLISTKYAKKPYRIAYNALDSRKLKKMPSPIPLTEMIAKRFFNFFRDYMPDAIVCTHPFAAKAVNELKDEGKVMAPAFGIVTDYTIHPFWEDAEKIEYIVTASELISHLAKTKGIGAERLLPLGIPCHPKFSEKRDGVEAKTRLGLDADKRSVLLMSGSMGYGRVLELVEELDRVDMDLQLICVCGNNVKLKARLELYRPRKSLRVLGFIDNVDEYMDAAECVVTKPGGLTITEALCKRLPMVLTEAIPGHEERNVDFVVNNGAGLKLNEHFSVSEAMHYLFLNPRRLELMEEVMGIVAKPQATARLCDFIINAVGGK